MELQDVVLWHVEALPTGLKPLVCLLVKCECLARAWLEAPCPGDLQHAIDNFPTVARSFQEQGCRGIILIYLALKQGPARDAFFAKWEECKHVMGPMGACGPPGCDRWLSNLFRMLAAAAAELEGSDLGIWSDNTSRGVGHHSGWLAFLQRMSVIRKVKASTGKRTRVKAAKAVKTVKARAGRQRNQGASMVDVSRVWLRQAARISVAACPDAAFLGALWVARVFVNIGLLVISHGQTHWHVAVWWQARVYA